MNGDLNLTKQSRRNYQGGRNCFHRACHTLHNSTLFSAQVSQSCSFGQIFPHVDLKSSCYLAQGYNAIKKNHYLCCISFLTFITCSILPNTIYSQSPRGSKLTFQEVLLQILPTSPQIFFLCLYLGSNSKKFSRFGLCYHNCAQSVYTEVVFIIQ